MKSMPQLVQLLCWKDLLLRLEAEPIKLQSSKNQFAADIYIKTYVTNFTTSKAKFQFVGKYNMSDDPETEMMEVSCKVFQFLHRNPQDEQNI